MNIGMNLLLWTTHVDQTHTPVLEMIKRIGYDGVEVPVFQGETREYTRLGKQLADMGLAATAASAMTKDVNPSDPDPAVRRRAVERLKWAVDCTHALGGKTLCGPLHSALGFFTGHGATDDETRRSADVLREAAEHAAQADVRFAVEYLNRFECYLLNTAADLKAYVELANHPSVCGMFDTFHAHIEETDSARAIRTLDKTMIHFHASANHRGTPGDDQINWPVVFGALKQVDYDGWVTVEAFGRGLPDLAAATCVWRDLFSSEAELCEQAHRFIRSQIR